MLSPKSLFGALLLLAVATAATVSAQPPTERVIQDQRLRYDLPLHPCLSPAAIAHRIALTARVPMGIEELPRSCQPDAAPGETTGEIVLAGLSVGEALDRLVTLDPRFVWGESDGVILIRPLAAWVDADHFLHRAVPAFSVAERPLHAALGAFVNALGPPRVSPDTLPTVSTPDGTRPFSVELGATSVIESLDAIVREHGATFWKVTYCRPPARREHATVFLYTFDGGGIGRHEPTRRDDGTWFSPCVGGPF